VLGGPGLPESVRHGVTTILLGSCSLSTIHVDGSDAGDLFGRVIRRMHVQSLVALLPRRGTNRGGCEVDS